MSIPTFGLKCDRCELDAFDVVVRPMRYRLTDDLTAHVRWQRGWCLDCRGVRAVEELPSEAELQVELEAIEAELGSFGVAPPRRLFGLLAGKRNPDTEWQLEYLRSDRQSTLEYMKFRRERIDPAKCLNCGGINYLLPTKEHSRSIDESHTTLGLAHPDCGGELILVEKEAVRFIFKSGFRSYNCDGKFLGFEET